MATKRNIRVSKRSAGGGNDAGDGASLPPPSEENPPAEYPEQFSIPADLVEHILLGPADDRRVLQDSPLLGDVWAAFALDPGNLQDVLITPHRSVTAALVASILPQALEKREAERARETNPEPAERFEESPKIAYLQGLVAARLFFDQVLRILVPLTQWWREPTVQKRLADLKSDRVAKLLIRPIQRQSPGAAADRENYTSLERYVALAGLIYWVAKLKRPDKCQRPKNAPKATTPLPPLPPLSAEQAMKIYEGHVAEIVAGMFDLYKVISETPEVLRPKPLQPRDDEFDVENDNFIFQVSLNRAAAPALDRSVPAVKGDAAKTLFKVDCRRIVWAVIDSGIDRTHPALVEAKREADQSISYTSRVRKTLDFTRIREIVSNKRKDLEEGDLKRIADAAGIGEKLAGDLLKEIEDDAAKRRPIDWERVEQLITVKPPALKTDYVPLAGELFVVNDDGKVETPFLAEDDLTPPSHHGTHVAGIIGAQALGGHGEGMCPDIRFYDFRVLGRTIEDTEFAVIAALQYIRYVNERHNYITIHGANLSLSIPHSVRNFACGRTPVCNECERLVESGVVVVAAAGNRGFQKFQTNDGVFENYAAFSITDPGNGDSVITVGSTHGNWPQTYGVSFFSSRGPTGDGRAKPDLVAPGERVMSTLPRGEWGPESGTSMAAPHVSGAAAMLLARYDELVGRPRRVKEILCNTATPLDRERSFQGHGMLDVLRALQSI